MDSKMFLFSILLYIFVTSISNYLVFSKDDIPQEPLRKVEYTAGNLRDPFLSWIPKKDISVAAAMPKEESIKAPNIGHLQGIIFGKTKKPQVIIDNNVFGIGDFLDEKKELKITDINKDGIKILYRDKTFLKSSSELSIKEEER